MSMTHLGAGPQESDHADRTAGLNLGMNFQMLALGEFSYGLL